MPDTLPTTGTAKSGLASKISAHKGATIGIIGGGGLLLIWWARRRAAAANPTAAQISVVSCSNGVATCIPNYMDDGTGSCSCTPIGGANNPSAAATTPTTTTATGRTHWKQRLYPFQTTPGTTGTNPGGPPSPPGLAPVPTSPPPPPTLAAPLPTSLTQIPGSLIYGDTGIAAGGTPNQGSIAAPGSNSSLGWSPGKALPSTAPGSGPWS